MPKVAVVNTPRLIALTKIGLLGLLYKLYDEVIVPSGVLKEFGNIELDCMKVADVDDRLEDLLVVCGANATDLIQCSRCR